MRPVRALCCLLLLLSASNLAEAQHLDARQQWQPQTENDLRLQQPVQLEIIGRAALTGLPILSEQTGVALTVAPEDLATVGERKLTVIAKGCTLKAIMVQLCEALQECHWDVDWDGEQLVYLLHRNAEAELVGLQEEREMGGRHQAEQRETRVARVEAARAALRMTPEQLAELEKTEPVLGRATREPHARALVEGLLSLPADQFAQFLDTGNVTFPYSHVPVPAQKAAESVLDQFAGYLQQELTRPPEGERAVEYTAGIARSLAAVKSWRDARSRLTVSVLDLGSEFGCGIWFGAWLGAGPEQYGNREAIIPARYISTDEGTGSWLRILQSTGTPDHDAAWAIITRNEGEGFRYARAKLEARRKAEWVVPTDPELLRVVRLPEGDANRAEVERALSQQTGLSVMADYFTGRGPYVTEDMAAGLPLWRMLYLLGEDSFGNKLVEWRKVGGCLVFHDLHWYQRAKAEIPESLLPTYQEKLQTQGRFTLNDVATFAVALGDRTIGFESLPQELARAGLGSASYARWGLRFYASLSPEQLEKARGETGLPYSEMTIAQRYQAAEATRKQSSPLLAEELPMAVFRVIEETRDRRAQGKTYRSTITRFRLQSGDATYEEAAGLAWEAIAP